MAMGRWAVLVEVGKGNRQMRPLQAAEMVGLAVPAGGTGVLEERHSLLQEILEISEKPGGP